MCKILTEWNSCLPKNSTIQFHWSGLLSTSSSWTGLKINSLRPRQNRRHFADDVFKCNFLNENVGIPINISLKFVPKGPINNIPALVQIMAWRCPGDKPLSEPMMVSVTTHICVTRPQLVNVQQQAARLYIGCFYDGTPLHWSTVQHAYNAVTFLQNYRNRHPTARYGMSFVSSKAWPMFYMYYYCTVCNVLL